jgi:hypothetical protein
MEIIDAHREKEFFSRKLKIGNYGKKELEFAMLTR